MQGVAAIDQHAVEDALLFADAGEERRVAVDVVVGWRAGSVEFGFEYRVVDRAAFLIDVLESGLSMPIERSPSQISFEQIVHRCETAARVDVRNSLQWREAPARCRHQ